MEISGFWGKYTYFLGGYGSASEEDVIVGYDPISKCEQVPMGLWSGV